MKDTGFNGADRMTQTGHAAGMCFSCMAVYGGMERGEKTTRRRGNAVFAEFLEADENRLLNLWGDWQVCVGVEDGKEITDRVLNVVKENIQKNK
ncbi:MAG: hypothetical protein LBQ28_08625 [Prevotellaceae bacterium]|jgi:hypothetical protein|nr:hypothetical protein [Prevotellaceae bacterium]